MYLTVKSGRYPSGFFKHFSEIRAVRKACTEGNIKNGGIRGAQQSLRRFNAVIQKIFKRGSMNTGAKTAQTLDRKSVV